MEHFLEYGLLFAAMGSVSFAFFAKGIKDGKWEIVLPFSYGVFLFYLFSALNLIEAFNLSK